MKVTWTQNADFRHEKVSKTVKKSSEKVLTGSRNCDIITELSARAAKASGTAMILENDTESRRTRTVIFTSHGKKKDSQFENEF